MAKNERRNISNNHTNILCESPKNEYFILCPSDWQLKYRTVARIQERRRALQIYYFKCMQSRMQFLRIGFFSFSPACIFGISMEKRKEGKKTSNWYLIIIWLINRTITARGKEREKSNCTWFTFKIKSNNRMDASKRERSKKKWQEKKQQTNKICKIDGIVSFFSSPPPQRLWCAMKNYSELGHSACVCTDSLS